MGRVIALGPTLSNDGGDVDDDVDDERVEAGGDEEEEEEDEEVMVDADRTSSTKYTYRLCCTSKWKGSFKCSNVCHLDCINGADAPVESNDDDDVDDDDDDDEGNDDGNEGGPALL